MAITDLLNAMSSNVQMITSLRLRKDQEQGGRLHLKRFTEKVRHKTFSIKLLQIVKQTTMLKQQK